MTLPKKPTIEFAPGCFDNFEGTQEELNDLIGQIQEMFENGDIDEMSRELTDEEYDELPDEVKAQLIDFSEDELIENRRKKLQ